MEMIFVVTRSETGKVKCLRNNSKVGIVPSGIRGEAQRRMARWKSNICDSGRARECIETKK
jgi:hypothetical protein